MKVTHYISYAFSLDTVLSYLFFLKIICHMLFVILIVKCLKKSSVKILHKIFFCSTTCLTYSRTWSLCSRERLNYPINLYFDFEYILAQKENMKLKVILASTLDLYLFVNYVPLA